MAIVGCPDESRVAELWPRTSRGAAPGGAHETVSPRPENRHTAPGALPLPGEPGPLPVGARLEGLWGGACFFALKRPFPPLGPRPDHNSGPQRSNFIKFAPREAPRAPPGGGGNHGRLSLAENAFEVTYVLKAGRGREVAGGGITIFRGGQPHHHKQDPRDSALGCSSVSARQQASLPPHWLLSHP